MKKKEERSRERKCIGPPDTFTKHWPSLRTRRSLHFSPKVRSCAHAVLSWPRVCLPSLFAASAADSERFDAIELVREALRAASVCLFVVVLFSMRVARCNALLRGKKWPLIYFIDRNRLFYCRFKSNLIE